MSNVKQVDMYGTLPHNYHVHPEIASMIAFCSNPNVGLRIAVMDEEDEEDFTFILSGQEAVSWKSLESFQVAVKKNEGRVIRSNAYDLEM